jgi:hypothetical protein
VTVPFGAKAYQLTNFKIIHDDVPPAPVLHIEPVFFDLTLGGEFKDLEPTAGGMYEITEMQYVEPDNIKVRYQPVRDTTLPDPGGLDEKIDGVPLQATDIQLSWEGDLIDQLIAGFNAWFMRTFFLDTLEDIPASDKSRR